MKKYLFLALPLLLCAARPEPQPCSKDSDSCGTASSGPVSPFLAASRAAPAGSGPAAAAPKPAAKAAVKDAVASPAPAAVELSTPPAAAATGAPAHSSPLWALVGAGGVAALYFYLGSAKRNRK